MSLAKKTNLRNPALLSIERSVLELRRGLPVLVNTARGEACLAVSSEVVTAQGLDDLRQISGGNLHILLTHNRASTLKIRLYTETAVAISLAKGDGLELIHHLADPANDLDHPLMGPFQAAREPLSTSQLAAIDLAKLAGLLPSVVTADLPQEAQGQVQAWALANSLLTVSTTDLTQVDAKIAAALEPEGPGRQVSLASITQAKVPLQAADSARLIAFRPQGLFGGGPEHLAIIIGNPDPGEPVLTRMHSECFTGDLLGSLKCDCGQQLRGAIDAIAKEGHGILLYLAQEGRGIGLMNKLRAYHLQDEGFDTVDANTRLGFEVDERLFDCAAQMLFKLGFQQVRLMTNNPDKVAQLEAHGVEIVERVAHAFPANEHNAHYLSTKAKKTGHLI
jgi:GTP cyclohydrolase II